MVALIADYVFPEILRSTLTVPGPGVQTDISTSAGALQCLTQNGAHSRAQNLGTGIGKVWKDMPQINSDTSFETGLLRTLTLCFKSLCNICTAHNEHNLLL